MHFRQFTAQLTRLGAGLLVLAVLTCAATAQAADERLTVRLLQADNSGGDSSPGLEDVAGLLQRTLRFTTYRLLGTGTLEVRDGAAAKLGQEIVVRLGAVAGKSMTVEVQQAGQRLVQTKVTMQPDKPIILGGIPGPGGGTLILVLNTI